MKLIIKIIAGLAYVAYEGYIMYLMANGKFTGWHRVGNILAITFLLLGIILWIVFEKKFRNRCKECKAPLYSWKYEWTLIRTYDTVTPDRSPATRVESYQITGTCQKCQKKIVYYKDFTVFDYRSGVETNAATQIENWRKGKFGD